MKTADVAWRCIGTLAALAGAPYLPLLHSLSSPHGLLLCLHCTTKYTFSLKNFLSHFSFSEALLAGSGWGGGWGQDVAFGCHIMASFLWQQRHNNSGSYMAAGMAWLGALGLGEPDRQQLAFLCSSSSLAWLAAASLALICQTAAGSAQSLSNRLKHAWPSLSSSSCLLCCHGVTCSAGSSSWLAAWPGRWNDRQAALCSSFAVPTGGAGDVAAWRGWRLAFGLWR